MSNNIAQQLQSGAVIAYPTEGVYGLGCDPLNKASVMRLLAIKQRAVDKGLILIASNWQQFDDYIIKPDEVRMQEIAKARNTTWIFDKSSFTPDWIAGNHETIAVRVTDHPVAKAICEAYGKPIVSTSANISTQPAAMNAEEVKTIFADNVGHIVEGEVGNLGKPTTIRDARTDNILRA